jgi:GTP cyclohydrolase FolE2
LISSSSQNNLEEYVDILQVQQLLLENSTASTSSSSTVNTVSYSTPPATSATTPSTSKNSQSRPRVNLQKASEYSQVQGKLSVNWLTFCSACMPSVQPHKTMKNIKKSKVSVRKQCEAPPLVCPTDGIIIIF